MIGNALNVLPTSFQSSVNYRYNTLNYASFGRFSDTISFNDVSCLMSILNVPIPETNHLKELKRIEILL